MAQATDKEARDKIYKYETGSDGSFKRQVSSFRSWISNEPGAQFPAEKDRYVCLYPKTLYSVDFLGVLEMRLLTRMSRSYISISDARGLRGPIL